MANQSPREFGAELARTNAEAEKKWAPGMSYHDGGMDDGDIQGVIMAKFPALADQERALSAFYAFTGA